MDDFLEPKKQQNSNSKVLIIGVIAGILVIVGVIGLFWKFSTVEPGVDDALEGAIFEGQPGFEDYRKEIIVSTDPDRLIQSVTGMGSITMFIGGSIYNKGDRKLSAIEVLVGVIDSKSDVIKEKKFRVLPSIRQEILGAGESMNVGVEIGGFTREDDRTNVQWKVTGFKFAD